MANLMERVQRPRSWIRVDTSGNLEVIELDKVKMMLKFDLSAHDVRLLDPSFAHPAVIIGREEAIVVKLEHIRCIITADEVLLLNSLDGHLPQYVVELQRRLTEAGVGGVSNSESADLSRRRGSRNFRNVSGNASPDHRPFEFRALEVALEAACTSLDSKATEIENEAYPLLDGLNSKIRMSDLERVCRLKRRFVGLTSIVKKFKYQIERLQNNNKKLAEMYLTRKKQRMESTSSGDQSSLVNRLTVSAPVSPFASRLSAPVSPVASRLSAPVFPFAPRLSAPVSPFAPRLSAPVSPVASRPDVWKPEKSFSIAKSQHKGMGSSESATKNIELELLLEAFFVKINSTLRKLTSLNEYLEDTENLISIRQDSVRNKLIQFELLMTTVSFVFTIFAVVAGIFGTNFGIQLYDNAGVFKWVLIITGATGIIIFLAFCWFLKYKRLL